MSKKPSRAERKQSRQKAARNLMHPSGTSPKPDAGPAPPAAQPARSSPPSLRRAEFSRAANRNRRHEQSSARRPPQQEETEAGLPEQAREKPAPASRWAGLFSNRRKRGEHALLVFLALVMLGAVIVFVAQRGRSGRMAPDPASTATPAADKAAVPAADLALPLPPQDDHSPPTIVTAAAKPLPAAAAPAEGRSPTEPDRASAKPAEAPAKPPAPAPKPAPAAPKPKKAPAPPAESDVY